MARNTVEVYSGRYQDLRPKQMAQRRNERVGSYFNGGVEPLEEQRYFRRLLEKFAREYFLSFPEYPCAYCGVLSPFRNIVWMEFCQRDSDEGKYGLESRLGVELRRNGQGEIAVCGKCHKRGRVREAPDIGG